jgi:hypothetical protein
MFRAFTTDIAIKYYATNQSNSQNAEALRTEEVACSLYTPDRRGRRSWVVP